MTIQFLQAVDLGANRIEDVTDPVAAQDAATKHYVDRLGSARSSSTASFTTVETVISNPKQMLANAIQAGTTLRFVAHGSCVNSNVLGGGTWEARVRLGTTNSTSDGIVMDSGSITGGGAATSQFELIAELTCYTTGTAATFKGHFTVISSTSGGMLSSNNTVVTGTMSTGNTTVANYANLTLVGSSAISFTVLTCTAEVVVA